MDAGSLINSPMSRCVFKMLLNQPRLLSDATAAEIKASLNIVQNACTSGSKSTRGTVAWRLSLTRILMTLSKVLSRSRCSLGSPPSFITNSTTDIVGCILISVRMKRLHHSGRSMDGWMIGCFLNHGGCILHFGLSKIRKEEEVLPRRPRNMCFEIFCT